MSIDLIPSDEIKRNWINFLKTVDERIKHSPTEETMYQLQIRLILDRIIAMKENDTGYVKLDEGQQDIVRRLLEKELDNGRQDSI